MGEERLERIRRILSCSEVLVHGFSPKRTSAWLTVDLTMPQLKTLIYVTRQDGATSGQIANMLGVGLSTTTGIVDRLTEQDMVTRREDPRDRRITRVAATARGHALVDALLEYRNEFINALLGQLDDKQLELVESAFQYLIEAAAKVVQERQQQEAVA